MYGGNRADLPDDNLGDRRRRLHRIPHGAPPARAGPEVVAFDSMEFGHRAAVGDVPLVIGNVGDPKAVADAVERYGINAVVHFAAYKSPGESMFKPQRYFGNNVAKSASLIETLRGSGSSGSSSPRPAPSTGRPSGCRWGRTPRSIRRAPTGRARP